jgi:hypothetical protein
MYPAISGGVVWRIDWSAQEEHLECQRRADQVYSQVAAALRQIGPEATPALVVVLRHPIPVMVRLAAEVLTDIGDAGALPNLRAAIRLWQHPPADVKNAIQEAINAIETRLSAFTGHELELVEPAPAAAAPSSGRELTAVGNGRGAVPSAAERTGRELEEAEEPPVREA